MAPLRHAVLVVDDEPDIVQSVMDLLRLDYDVHGATGAAEAMKILDANDVHVIMTDQRMPDMTGIQLLSRVKEEHPDTIRLLFTGYADVTAVIDAINRGSVYRYITKPWVPHELETVIASACERYDLILDRRRLVADLETANAELAQANELKTAFIRVVGHELRTPITVQLGLAGLILRTEGLAPPSVRDRMQRIERVTLRLARRSEQLMVLLHEQRFGRTLDKQPTDMAALVRGAADDVRPFVERRAHTLRVDVGDDVGALVVDGAKIADTLEQLLLNAIKFTPDGGALAVSARRTAEGVHVEVSDTGIGVAPEIQPHLFEPFFTGLDTEHHSSGDLAFNARGLGLGLSMVRAFVEMHGGTVTFRSNPERGSTFSFDLPAPAAIL